MHLFIHILTLRVWFVCVLPYLFFRRLNSAGRVHCHVLLFTPLALRSARLCARLLGNITLQVLEFDYSDMRDDDNVSLGLKSSYFNLASVHEDMERQLEWEVLAELDLFQHPLGVYLTKTNATMGALVRDSLRHVLFVIEVVSHLARRESTADAKPVLILTRRPWMESVERFATARNVQVVAVAPRWVLNCREWGRLALGENPAYVFRYCKRVYRTIAGLWGSRDRELLQDVSLRYITVQEIGQCNLDRPECHSDLFFWQQSALKAEYLLVNFNQPWSPLDEEKWQNLRDRGFAGVAIDGCVKAHDKVPHFARFIPPLVPHPSCKSLLDKTSISGGRLMENRWMRKQINAYASDVYFWDSYFDTFKTPIFITHYRHLGQHCAITAAVRGIGGVMGIYQRSFEAVPHRGMASVADLFFGFSHAHAEVERKSGSIIPYHIVTGYLGDHRFSLVKSKAIQLRKQLAQHGAKMIIAFYDENTVNDDPRWLQGHTLMRRDYAFLLEKVLSEPWLGLVLKPKMPTSLRSRLGEVNQLLEAAEATGRCHLYDESKLLAVHPPALAALAADVAIHQHLHAATAGVEAALAGTPTLMLDPDGWSVSPLMGLGEDKVVFTQWDVLWDALVKFRTDPSSVPGFGDWSPMLDELDPFRDGCAAERMGTYLEWLVEGYKEGLPRETILADAAERYSCAWGADKIKAINC